MARIKMTAAVHRRISKRDLLAALRHAGMPLDTHRNRAYFIGIDSRGREFEIILAADDRDDDLWHAIHALQTRYRKELVRMSNRKIDPAEIHFDENTAVEVADLENEEYYVEGERLTEESAQRLAAEMLERVRAKNLRPGGKSLSGGNKHSPVVQVRVSELTRDKLQAIADARGMSVSKLSRKVLDEFVKRETLEQ